MRAVLISIHPKWCELIASGKKTVEVRKTKPKLEIPFKCYIYATKPRHYYKISKHLLISDESLFLVNGKVRICEGFGVEYEDREYKHLNCKVIGEFVCDRITEYECSSVGHGELATTCGTCLTYDEIINYCNGNELYGWHISDLVIYDKPRELSEFEFPKDYIYQSYRKRNHYFKGITRPPQSWCYVEEVEIL